MLDVRADIGQLKETVVTAVKVLINEGLIDAFGHASLRVPGADLVLVPGHTHTTEKTIADVTVDDIVTMDLDGKTVKGELDPPGERFLYTSIYRARPDVGGIVHVHPPTAIAFTVAGRPILPVWTQGSFCSPAVPVYDNPDQINTPARGDEIARLLGQGDVVMLRSHGCAAAGATLAEACVLAINLERNAVMQWQAAALGQPRAIEATFLRNGMMTGVPRDEFVNAYWAYYVDKMRRGLRGR